MILTFFTPTLKLTGGNLVMFRYAEALASEGHTIYVIAPDAERKQEIKNGVIIKTFKKIPNKYIEHFFFELPYLLEFYKTMEKSDILIPIFFPLVIHSILCKKLKKCKKVIPLFQDVKEMYWFGKYIYFLLGRKFVQKNVDNIIAISDPIAEEIEQYSSLKPVVIKNSIDKEFFYKRNVEKENYILFVGSSAKSKGFTYFLKAFNLLKKYFPTLNAKVVSPVTENFVKDGIEYININNDRNKLGELYAKAMVFVSQSLGDSFGLPPLEAMACGTAVIVTDTIGSKEYAINGKNSLVVPVKNVIETVKAIKLILQNQELRIHIAQNGIETARKYNWDESVRMFEQEVLN